MDRRLLAPVVLAPLVLALYTGAARAQYAPQGSNGRALERDLRIGGTGNAPRADFGAEVRFRNSIITGNAPGGFSFHGDVGYTDPNEFRGRLPSDDLYSFRRDSLSSGLAGQGFRGTESIQYQFSLSTGATARQDIPTRYTVGRLSGAAASVATSLTERGAVTAGSPARTSSWDIAAVRPPAVGTLRSTAAYAAGRALSPVLMDTRTTEAGVEVTAASGLLGVRRMTPGTPGGVGAIGAKDEERKARENPAAPGRAVESPQGARLRTAYDEFRERLDRAAQALPETPAKAPRPESTPGEKKPGPGEKPGAAGKPEDALHAPGTPTNEPSREPSEWEKRMQEIRDSLAAGSSSKKKDKRDADTKDKGLDKDTVDALRRSGEHRATTLLPEVPANRDLYAEHMSRGQKFMSEERYFDAEERFAHALTLKKGDPSAMAGRLNAQLGSGLFVSAATNLKSLVTEYPDFVGMRFAAPLLPGAQRQTELVQQLRSNLTSKERLEWRLPQESAILLAYLGYQRSDLTAVREGLSALRAEAVEPKDVKLVDLLAAVWLAEPKTPSENEKK